MLSSSANDPERSKVSKCSQSSGDKESKNLGSPLVIGLKVNYSG